MNLIVKEISTSNRRIIDTTDNIINLYTNYFTWKVESTVELTEEEITKRAPEFIYCVVNKTDVAGLELVWDLEELLWKFTVVGNNFKFVTYSEERKDLLIPLNTFKTWLYEN